MRRPRRRRRRMRPEVAPRGRRRARRIARELHDVVAHPCRVMVVQAGGARRSSTATRRARRGLARDRGRPGGRRWPRCGGCSASSATATTSRPRAAAALRGSTRWSSAPAPRACRSTLEVEGEPRSLPAGMDLSAYRIVQEALTNALRHAGAARPSVTVRWRPRASSSSRRRRRPARRHGRRRRAWPGRDARAGRAVRR